MYIKRLDPEQVDHLDTIWRPLHCLIWINKWRKGQVGSTNQQQEDAGYCLDRYSLRDAEWKSTLTTSK